jgi:two-component system sensor histidine kinase UhpB
MDMPMNNVTKILIAEHDVVDLELMHYQLERDGMEYQCQIVQNESDYSEALTVFCPDIILSDYNFPSFHGTTAFEIREIKAPDTPFIFVTGAIGEEKSVELMKLGVTDFVLKTKLFTLSIKIRRALKESKDKIAKREIEHELMQSGKRLARAQHLASMGSWELDFTSNDIRWSEEVYRIYGLQPNASLQSIEKGLALTHPEDLGYVQDEIRKSKSSSRNYSTNYRIVNNNGEIRHIYSEGQLEFDSNGKPAGLYGITHDITERVLLENKLAAERSEKQREITEAVLTAQETERAEIGKELHDNLNQILGATKLYVELAKTDEVNRPLFLDKCSGFLVNVIEEIRKISKNMANPAKRALGLFVYINILLDDLRMVHPLKIQFHTTDIEEADIDEKLQLTIYRIVQEQVNNILNHANASHATIRLSRRLEEIVLLISDNGKGCDTLEKNNGVGIINIKSRAELYHGMVTINSKLGEGYDLEVVLSLKDYKLKSNVLSPRPILEPSASFS